MEKQSGKTWTRVLTGLGILGGLYLPSSWVSDFLPQFSIALILLGIPHGASDFLIFSRMTRQLPNLQSRAHFFLLYALVMIGFLVVWWLQPMIGFSIFILTSIYHFGQSNWADVKFQSTSQRLHTYFIWGAAILGTPILLHFDEASFIIHEITQTSISLKTTHKVIVILILIFSNFVWLAHLAEKVVLSGPRFTREMANFLLLMVLFFTTPLLIGFGIYFVFWHSFESMKDQVRFFSRTSKSPGWKSYLLEVLPMSGIALGGLGLAFFIQTYWIGGATHLGLVFLFLAVITMPHALLMDRLYAITS